MPALRRLSQLPRAQLAAQLSPRLRLLAQLQQTRSKTTSSKQTPKVAKVAKLAQPTRFTPPSHPSTPPGRRGEPVNYPGPPPARDPAKSWYPNTMPPEGTLLHRFIHNRLLHFCIAASVLIALGLTAAVQNYLRFSPYSHEIQWAWSEPFASLGRFFTVWRKTVLYESRMVMEKRKKKADDVDKRGAYRKAHGLENEEGWLGWSLRRQGGESVPSPLQKAAAELEAARPEAWVEEELKKVEKEAGVEGVVPAGEQQTPPPPPPPPEAKPPKEKRFRWQWW